MKAKLGSGARFRHLTHELEGRGARDPKALAAFIGRKSLGAHKMAELAAKGRARHGHAMGGPIGQMTEGMDSAPRYAMGGYADGGDTEAEMEDEEMEDEEMEEHGEQHCPTCTCNEEEHAMGGKVHGQMQTPAGGPMSFHDALNMKKFSSRGAHLSHVRPGPSPR